jgi:hypothetical protein
MKRNHVFKELICILDTGESFFFVMEHRPNLGRPTLLPLPPPFPISYAGATVVSFAEVK